MSEKIETDNQLIDNPAARPFITQAQSALKTGDYTMVLSWCQMGLKKCPNNIRLLHLLYTAERERGNYRQAAQALEAIEKNGGNPYIVAQGWGILEMKRGHHKLAEQHLRRALELSPNDKYILSALANLRAKEGRYGEAKMIVRDILREHPEDGFVWLSLISFIFQENPNDMSMWGNAALDELYSTLTEALNHILDQDRVLYSAEQTLYKWCQLECKRRQVGLANFDRVLAQLGLDEQKRGFVLYVLSRKLSQMRQHKDAHWLAASAAKLWTENLSLYLWAAELALRTGDVALSQEAIHQMLQKAPHTLEGKEEVFMKNEVSREIVARFMRNYVENEYKRHPSQMNNQGIRLAAKVLAWACVYTAQYKEAIHWLSVSLKHAKDKNDLLWLACVIAASTKQTRYVLETFERVQNDPRLASRIAQLIANKLYDEADEGLRREIEEKMACAAVQNVNAWRTLINRVKRGSDYRHAVRLCQLAIKANPEQYIFWRDLGAIYDRRGDKERTLKAYIRALRRSGYIGNMCYLVVSTALLHKREDVARTALRATRKRAGVTPGYMVALITYCLHRGKQDAVRNVLPKFSATIPMLKAYTLVHYATGCAALKVGLYDVALKHIQSTIRFSRDRTRARLTLGVLYAKMGQYDMARAVYQKLLEQHRNTVMHAKILRQWAITELSCGNVERGRHLYNCALQQAARFDPRLYQTWKNYREGRQSTQTQRADGSAANPAQQIPARLPNTSIG